MKSKVIKQRNIPTFPIIEKTIRVKPLIAIMISIIIGIILVLFNDEFALYGLVLFGVGLFCLVFLPDVKIIEYTDKYAVIYNCREKDECKLIYWDEILSWQYKWHTDKDEMIIEMVDHSVEIFDSYAKSTVVPYFRKYVGAKEKNRKGK